MAGLRYATIPRGLGAGLGGRVRWGLVCGVDGIESGQIIGFGLDHASDMVT